MTVELFLLLTCQLSGAACFAAFPSKNKKASGAHAYLIRTDNAGYCSCVYYYES